MTSPTHFEDTHSKIPQTQNKSLTPKHRSDHILVNDQIYESTDTRTTPIETLDSFLNSLQSVLKSHSPTRKGK